MGLLKRRWERIYARTTERLPATIAPQLDLMRPSFWRSWGGPLNGQIQRQRIVWELVRTVAFDGIVETGTYCDVSTEFFDHVSPLPVRTVEGNRRFFENARYRLQPYPQVRVEFGASRAFLRSLAEESGSVKKTMLFYLDAHWEDALPLREELEFISATWSRSVVMIDDFQVPDDPQCRFDDYRLGKRLTADYLPAESLQGCALFYPAAPSHEETGLRRSSVTLAFPELVPLMSGASSLRALLGGTLRPADLP